MASKRLIYTIGLTIGVVSLIGCGGSSSSTPFDETARFDQPVIPLHEQLSHLEAPNDHSRALWDKLVNKLMSEVEALGTDHQPASAPTSPASQIDDLQIYATGGDPQLKWAYKNQGDYDQNGEVNLGDITQIVLHFSKSKNDSDWAEAQLADGDGNGEVNLSDVTPIALNFNKRVAGYQVQFSPGFDDPQEWPDELITVAFSESRIVNYIRTFDIQANLGQDDGLARVAPVESLAETGTPGLASNASIYIVGAPAPGDWAMPGHDRRHTSRSAVNAPERIGTLWSEQIVSPDPGSTYDIRDPVVDSIGNIYVGGNFGIRALDSYGAERWLFKETVWYPTSAPVIAGNGLVIAGCLVEPSQYKLYAIHPDDGSEIWQLDLEAPTSTPVIGPFGRIVVYDQDGIFCIDQLGTVIWFFPVDTSFPKPSWVSIDDQGLIYVVTNSPFDWGEYSRPGIIVLNPDGELQWVFSLEDYRDLPEPFQSNYVPMLGSAPVILDDGRIAFQTFRKVHCYNRIGELQWEYSLQSAEARIEKGLVLNINGDLICGINDPLSDPPRKFVTLTPDGNVAETHGIQNDTENSIKSTYADGSLMFNSGAQQVTAINFEGQEMWQIDPRFGLTNSDNESYFCVRDDGSMIVVHSGEVYCYDSFSPSYLDPPDAISATQGDYVDHVTVNWSGVPFAESYVVYRSDREVPLCILLPNGLPPYHYDDYSVLNTEPIEYRISAATTQGEGGLSSPAVGYMAPTGITNTGPGDWAQPRHDQKQNSQSSIIGPVNPEVLWVYESGFVEETEEPVIHSVPVFGDDGTCYVTTNEHSNLLSISAEGTLNWIFHDGGHMGQPVLNPAGDIIVFTPDTLRYDLDGVWKQYPYDLVSIKPDRTVNWKVPIERTPNELTVDQDGNVFFLASPLSLLKCDTAGNLTEVPTPFEPQMFWNTAPAIGGDGILYMSMMYSLYSYQSVALSEDSGLLWEEHDASQNYGEIALGNNGEIYSGTIPGMRYDSLGNVLWESDQYYLVINNRVVVGPDYSFYAMLSSSGVEFGRIGRFSPDGELLLVIDQPSEKLSSLSMVVDAQNNLYGITVDGMSLVGINSLGELMWEIASPVGTLFSVDLKPGLRDDGVLVVATQNGLVAIGD